MQLQKNKVQNKEKGCIDKYLQSFTEKQVSSFKYPLAFTQI